MAQLDYINFGGIMQITVNVSNTVGLGGVNRQDDVALIQALFNYIAEGGMGPEYLGFYNTDTRVEISGKLDQGTRTAIERFVYENASGLIGNRFDFLIHPASYKGRVIRNMTGPIMAITRLHIWASAVAFKRGHRSYVTSIKDVRLRKFWP